MIVLTSAFVLLSAFSCGGGGKATGTNEQSEKVVVNVPQFDADSAYLLSLITKTPPTSQQEMAYAG